MNREQAAAVLNVGEDASAEEVWEAFRQRISVLNSDPSATDEQFGEATTARDILLPDSPRDRSRSTGGSQRKGEEGESDSPSGAVAPDEPDSRTGRQAYRESVEEALDEKVRDDDGSIDYTALQGVAKNTEGVPGSGLKKAEMYTAIVDETVSREYGSEGLEEGRTGTTSEAESEGQRSETAPNVNESASVARPTQQPRRSDASDSGNEANAPSSERGGERDGVLYRLGRRSRSAERRVLSVTASVQNYYVRVLLASLAFYIVGLFVLTLMMVFSVLVGIDGTGAVTALFFAASYVGVAAAVRVFNYRE